MSSREDILQNIRRNTRTRYERPDLTSLEEEALTYADPVGQFCKIMVQMGGKAVVLGKEDDLNEVIRQLYPDAKRIASILKEVPTGEKSNLSPVRLSIRMRWKIRENWTVQTLPSLMAGLVYAKTVLSGCSRMWNNVPLLYFGGTGDFAGP